MTGDDKSSIAEKQDQDQDSSSATSGGSKSKSKSNKGRGRGILARIWKALFRLDGDDLEKRLHYLSEEEASVLNRIANRSLHWRRMSRRLILHSFFLWVISVGYAIMTTRSLNLDWKTRALRLSPMFLWPALSFLAYSALARFLKMRDHKDHRTLERLRAERQAKIDELKEKTNYYITQQLIQRYDPDPTAKAAAARVLASKLGADSGLQVSVVDELKLHATEGKSSDVELMESSGLRNRKQVQARPHSTGSNVLHHSNEELTISEGVRGSGTLEESRAVTVQHHGNQGSVIHDGGWLARIAALLVGEDPTQSYALICGNCHMHNGLVRKEDFVYITYYCPHCHALNKSRHAEACISDPNSGNVASTAVSSCDDKINNGMGFAGESISTSDSSKIKAAEDIGGEKIAAAD